MEPKKDEPTDLSEVILNENTDTNTEDRKSLKRPKRVLHFSDGDLEEYSDDETDTPDTNKVTNQIDPKTLNWLPWAWYRTTCISSKLLDGCDYTAGT
ncbi:Protein FAM177A1 [Anthophora plagiata]